MDPFLQTLLPIPLQIAHTPGGVARNIAAVIAGLLPLSQHPPLLCTLLGKDVAGLALLASLKQLR